MFPKPRAELLRFGAEQVWNFRLEPRRQLLPESASMMLVVLLIANEPRCPGKTHRIIPWILLLQATLSEAQVKFRVVDMYLVGVDANDPT